jgi:Tol biopolymer transport system component
VRAWAAVLLAPTLLALPAAPAFATFPGRTGVLAGAYGQTDRAQDVTVLELFRSNGLRVRDITSCTVDTAGRSGKTGTCPRHPAFSADGARIALGLEGRLALAAADGSGLSLLPQLTGADADPAWSPDGKQLVFTGRASGRRNLFTVNADGSGLTQLSFAGGRQPAWSSRGQIAYVAAGRVWRVGSSVRRRVRLARGQHPDFSPSGRSVAYDYRGAAYAVATRGGAPRRPLVARATEPVFAPDGRRLAFLRAAPGDRELGDSVYLARLRDHRVHRVRAGGEQPVGSTFRNYVDLAWRALSG